MSRFYISTAMKTVPYAENTNQDFFSGNCIVLTGFKERGAHRHARTHRKSVKETCDETEISPHQSLSVTEEITNVLKSTNANFVARGKDQLF